MVKILEKSTQSLNHYERKYTWSHAIGDTVMAHTDGAVSCLIEWEGVDAEFMTDDDRLQYWPNIYRLLDLLPIDYFIESHFWREHDYSLANEYLDKGADMVRGQKIAGYIRDKHAAHLSQFARVNSVAFVLVYVPPKKNTFFAAKKNLIQQAKDAEGLLETARKLMRNLNSPRIVNIDAYRARIRQSIDRSAYNKKLNPTYNPQILMNEQVIRNAPAMKDGVIEIDGHFTKVLYLYLYPDATPGWFDCFAYLSHTFHISHIISSTDTRVQIKKIENEQTMLQGMASRRGHFTTAKGLSEMSSFQQLVTDQNLSIFRNSFVIHVHSESLDKLNLAVDDFNDIIEKNNGELRTADYIQYPWLRAGQPGQGYRAPMFRPDHTWQVGDMMPLQVYKQGDRMPESLRLGACSQLIGHNLTEEAVAHSMTAAMTGSGKGVDKGTQIIESYPFGVDWYICEVGQSYRWVVEAFGGTYTTINPDKDVVNPLPPYDVAHFDLTKKDALPLDAKIIGGTIDALSFLLTDGELKLDVHQGAAAQMALQMVYAMPETGFNSPTLETFLNVMDSDDFKKNMLDSDRQREAAKSMAEKLSSFLISTEGRLFKNRDNLILSEGITGVDLNQVRQSSGKLMKFYLVFISLRFSQLAFFRANKSRILLDEMHEFVRVFPEVMGPLISGVARMGRKEHGFIDLVTQGISEIDIIEKEVLNSMRIRSLMYRADGHNEIAERINMPAGALEKWRSFKDPIKFDWRPGIRSIGDDYYNLYHTYPPEILAMVDTSDLKSKNIISEMTMDPLERIHLFYNRG